MVKCFVRQPYPADIHLTPGGNDNDSSIKAYPTTSPSQDRVHGTAESVYRVEGLSADDLEDVEDIRIEAQAIRRSRPATASAWTSARQRKTPTEDATSVRDRTLPPTRPSRRLTYSAPGADTGSGDRRAKSDRFGTIMARVAAPWIRTDGETWTDKRKTGT